MRYIVQQVEFEFVTWYYIAYDVCPYFSQFIMFIFLVFKILKAILYLGASLTGEWLYILLIQSILVFPIASDENLGVEARDCRGKAACYTPNFLKFPKISCGFLKRVLKKRKYMEIGNSRKSKEIYRNIMLLPTISIFCFSWCIHSAHFNTILHDFCTCYKKTSLSSTLLHYTRYPNILCSTAVRV